MVLFSPVKDWKQFLSLGDEEKLNDILKKVSKYRGAYKNSSEVKLSQLWCAILELYKQNLILQKKMNRIENVFENMFEQVRREEREREEIAKTLERF